MTAAAAKCIACGRTVGEHTEEQLQACHRRKPQPANVCTACDGTGRAAIESNAQGHQMGDCPRCTRNCASCSSRIFIADAEGGCCKDCLKGDYPMSQAGAQL